jgi:hypothetical protein
MSAYIHKALELYNAFDYGSESEWRERQAKWVNNDVGARGGVLAHKQRMVVKSKLTDQPSSFRPQDQPGYQGSVSEHRVTIKSNGCQENTEILHIDRKVPPPWFSKQRPAKDHTIYGESAHAYANGTKQVKWISQEEIETKNGLHSIERHHFEEDIPGFVSPFNHQRRKRRKKQENLIFKSSFAHDPSSMTPFYPRVDKDLPIKRSLRGRELLEDVRPAKDKRR